MKPLVSVVLFILLSISLFSTLYAQEQLKYQFSLLPGGIKSDADFENRLSMLSSTYDGNPALTEALSQHYADVGFLHKTWQQHDTMVWSSYLKGSTIYWCPVKLHAGEEMFEDRYGNIIRGRCGNRISSVPRTPREFVPPSIPIIDIPYISVGVPPSIPRAPLSPPSIPTLELPPPFVPIGPLPPIGPGGPVIAPIPTTISPPPYVPIGVGFPGIPYLPIFPTPVGNTPELPTDVMEFIGLGLILLAGQRRR